MNNQNPICVKCKREIKSKIKYRGSNTLKVPIHRDCFNDIKEKVDNITCDINYTMAYRDVEEIEYDYEMMSDYDFEMMIEEDRFREELKSKNEDVSYILNDLYEKTGITYEQWNIIINT